MTKQTIDIGASANDGTGDTLRSGATKINENFTELYDAVEVSFNVSSIPGSYVFQSDGRFFLSDEINPVLYLNRGTTYKFIVDASGHPFQIREGDGGAAYNTGVANNTDDVGTITFTPTMSSPSTLYYQCTIHSSMGNVINII
jgi:hypothetical protein